MNKDKVKKGLRTLQTANVNGWVTTINFDGTISVQQPKIFIKEIIKCEIGFISETKRKNNDLYLHI